MSKKRRNWFAQKKSEIVLEILWEELTLSEISKKDEIARPVLNRWKGDFINDMSAVFDKKGEGVEKIRKQHEEERCS